MWSAHVVCLLAASDPLICTLTRNWSKFFQMVCNGELLSILVPLACFSCGMSLERNLRAASEAWSKRATKVERLSFLGQASQAIHPLGSPGLACDTPTVRQKLFVSPSELMSFVTIKLRLKTPPRCCLWPGVSKSRIWKQQLSVCVFPPLTCSSQQWLWLCHWCCLSPPRTT